MQIVHSDSVLRVAPRTTPDYDRDNPLTKLLGMVEGVGLAAEREHYWADHTQYLVPFDQLELHGPSAPQSDVLDPVLQDNKDDFQKQNLRGFFTSDTQVVRGWAEVDGWAGPFLRVSYRGGPDSKLSRSTGHALGDHVKLWLRVGDATTLELIRVPYNAETGRYEVELWGYPGSNLGPLLDARGAAALDRGELQLRPDLIRGTTSEFNRNTLDHRFIVDVAPDHTMHPVLPLAIELAWADASEQTWDSQRGANYRYAFNMIVRGWDHFLRVGPSLNPHGGVGSLEYRTLASNYGRHGQRPELGRSLAPWSFNAFGNKDHGGSREPFFAVDYMDIHILRGTSGIGLHRHRDNQEVFLMMEGRGLMVVGDFCKMPERERCLEVRTLRAGHLAMLKGGQLHALANPTDEDSALFMFGGYD
ncbi:cupin domain-containing protein [Sorangium sp. So ce1000]|uniref:cupin domain-containing protein n=1 Tax=Sorangium sp. So ce1000 TaxID=3133325 RepID=UPI003F613BC0